MTRRGYSLLRVLFVSMVLLALALFVAMQFVEAGRPDPDLPPDAGALHHWFNELSPVAVMIVTTTAAIWLTLQLALRPMRRLSAQAGAIGPDTLDARLSVEHAPAEIVPLVTAFNASLDRLETAWTAQRAFSANAAHELRMPLAALRAHVESLLPPAERGVATAEFDRLGRVVEQLLFLAEADHDRLTRRDRFDLAAVVRDACTAIAPHVLSRGGDIGFSSDLESYHRWGDPILVGVALRNLIENAVEHSAGPVSIVVHIDTGGTVSVRDDGDGVPPEFRDRLFHRFAKFDCSGPGAGLGLSIVTRVMTLHGGQARYEPLPHGSAFHLAFPPLARA